MNPRHAIPFLVLITLIVSVATCAQTSSPASSSDAAFWVEHWSKPPVVVFGPEQEAFDSGMQVILFPWNDHDEPSNPTALDANIRWLKEHPKVRLYVHGYASSRGDLVYNLNLSQRRADWVKQVMVSQGVPENHIKMAVGWGELYPVCPEENDDCWTKNRLVRFVYAPD